MRLPTYLLMAISFLSLFTIANSSQSSQLNMADLFSLSPACTGHTDELNRMLTEAISMLETGFAAIDSLLSGVNAKSKRQLNRKPSENMRKAAKVAWGLDWRTSRLRKFFRREGYNKGDRKQLMAARSMFNTYIHTQSYIYSIFFISYAHGLTRYIFFLFAIW